MAANAIKHGPGPSANKLATLRPDLFQSPVLARLGLANSDDAKPCRAARVASSAFAPLAGDALYVSKDDLSKWCVAVIAYWEELSVILDEQQRRHSVD